LLVGGAVVAASLSRSPADWGDLAVIQVQVARALHLHVLVGPYSRFGWHDLGPVYFYALAPFYLLGGQTTASLFLGALMVNAGAAVATVVLVRRRMGEGMARWAGAVVAAYLVVTGSNALTNPSNAAVLALPLLLALVLVALGGAGSWACLVWAGVIGSFLVQTHISTVPEVAVALVVGLVARTLPSAGGPRSGGGGPGSVLARIGLVSGIALIALMWVAPVYQQVAPGSGSAGNIGAVVRFFLAGGHGGARSVHPLGQAARAVVDQLAFLPLGQPGAGAVVAAAPGRLSIAALYLVVAVVVTAAGLARRRRLPAILGLLTLTGTGTAVLAATRVVGPLYGYFLQWMTVLPVPALIGAGLVVQDRKLGRPAGDVLSPVGPVRSARDHHARHSRRRRPAPTLRRSGRIALLVAVLVPAAGLGWAFDHGSVGSLAPTPAVPTVARAATSGLERLHSHGVLVRIASHDLWPIAAGVVVDLRKEGFDVSISEPWPGIFGPEFRRDGTETAEVVLADESRPGAPAPPAGATTVPSRFGATTGWAEPLGPGGGG
ncbi:MAG: hypothetical protein ACRDZY_04605, partial [Acidimicrobiales bacterium]